MQRFRKCQIKCPCLESWLDSWERIHSSVSSLCCWCRAVTILPHIDITGGLGPGAHNAVFHYDTRPQCYAPWNNNYTRVWDPNPPHTVIFMIHKTLPGLDSQPQPSYKARPDPPTCLWCDKSFKYSFIGCLLECCDMAFSDECRRALSTLYTKYCYE